MCESILKIHLNIFFSPEFFSAYMAEQPAVSLEILKKRKNTTPQIESIVKQLQDQIAGKKSE